MLDMTNNMRKIARTCFHNAKVVIVHFHVQKLALEAVQEERIRLRWRAIDEDNRLRKEAKTGGKISSPQALDNKDTRRKLLVYSRYLLYKSPTNGRPPRRNEPRHSSGNPRQSSRPTHYRTP